MKHELIDQRKLEMGELVSKKLRLDPQLLRVVQQQISKHLNNPSLSESVKHNYREWDQIVRQGPGMVIHVLTSDDENSNRLRQSSPCNCLVTQQERSKILSRYRNESLRT